jgi:hypothetical protein
MIGRLVACKIVPKNIEIVFESILIILFTYLERRRPWKQYVFARFYSAILLITIFSDSQISFTLFKHARVALRYAIYYYSLFSSRKLFSFQFPFCRPYLHCHLFPTYQSRQKFPLLFITTDIGPLGMVVCWIQAINHPSSWCGRVKLICKGKSNRVNEQLMTKGLLVSHANYQFIKTKIKLKNDNRSSTRSGAPVLNVLIKCRPIFDYSSVW